MDGSFFAVTSHTTTMNIFDRYLLGTEDIVFLTLSQEDLTQSFMVHFNTIDFSCNIDWSKGDQYPGFQNTSLRSAHRDSTNATNFIDVLERQKQGLVSWTRWWQKAIHSFQQCGSTGIPIFMGDFQSLEPRHVSTWLQHVVIIPTRCWHKSYCVGGVANILNVSADFLNDLLVYCILSSCRTTQWNPFCEHQQLVLSHPVWKPEGHTHGSAHSWRHLLQIHQHQQQ
ncbi:unnamed protein product [Gulo gulo]|uniref:Uncharacterized protein n=1 Tax=Gulo gulo TaxID=48420 RepID=A0A9X9Q0G2_GULGU|nr:unnamed protein product [Gulo gulo]